MEITYTPSRGKAAGKTFVPHRDAERSEYVVSKTRFKEDYIYVPDLETVWRYLCMGYRVRMSEVDNPVSPSLISPKSITVI